jgi:ATP-dependent protease HslVU (ClpYQ) peptidase subunit
MTVIVAAVTGEHVTLAADRKISAGWEVKYHEQPKLWVNGKWAIGAAGSLRAAQVLKHHVSWPIYRADEEPDLEAFLVRTLVPALRSGSSSHGIVHAQNGIERIEASLLVAHGTRIATISTDGSVIAEPAQRMAIGSGSAEALGALGNRGPWTEGDVIEAARRATITDAGCGGPISVVNTATLRVRQVDAEAVAS